MTDISLEKVQRLMRERDEARAERDAACRERDLLVTWMRNLPSPEDVELARLEIERSPDVIAAIRKLNGDDDDGTTSE